jgi:hypothetical protein
MITEADLPKAVDRLDNAAMLAIAREAGMTPPTEAELPEARLLASSLMDHEVVGIETLLAVRRIQPAATLVHREGGRITAVAGQLILRTSSVRPLLAGRFDALNVDTDYLARDGDLVALGYAWGIAASTKTGGQAIGAFNRMLRERLFPHIAGFTRAVTPIGRHVAATRYGYAPLRHPDDDLMIAIPGREAVFA